MKKWYVGTIKDNATYTCGIHLERYRNRKVIMYYDCLDDDEIKVFRGRMPSENNTYIWNWWEYMFSDIQELS